MGYEVGRLVQVGHFPHGKGHLGHSDHLHAAHEREAHRRHVARAIGPVVVEDRAHCGDARRYRRVDLLTNPRILARYASPQLFGGTGIAATNAALGADLELVRGAQTYTDAHTIVSEVLAEKGIFDAGHDICAAVRLQPRVTKDRLAYQAIGRSLQSLEMTEAGDMGRQKAVAGRLRRLPTSFYDGWDAATHKNLVVASGGSYANVAATDHPVHHGHTPGSLAIITEEGVGLRKNQLHAESDGAHQALAVTPWFMDKIADALDEGGGTRGQLIAAHWAHVMNLGNLLFAGPSENHDGLPLLVA
ncbi:MAG TPA: hypothetical protein VLF91_00140 [Candidatus Saccharimonadales bacterium]|nr:hypothetical protein [Candidatus Saccharimonadales bacterium]